MRLASEFDFLILEDDPYFHLTLSESTTDGSVRPPSLRSLDTEGRVIRFESLSKVLSAGMRLGWVTGHPKLVERVNLHMQCSSLHTSGVSQVLAYTLFKEWGEKGCICGSCAETTDWIGLLECPESGNVLLSQSYEFELLRTLYSHGWLYRIVWIKLDGVADSRELIQTGALSKKVILVPGQEFSPSDTPSSYVRASFSLLDTELFDEALSRLAALLRDYHSASSSQ